MSKKTSVIVTFDGFPAPLLQHKIDWYIVNGDVILITLPDSEDAHALRNSFGDVYSKNDAIMLLAAMEKMARDMGKRTVAIKETYITGNRLFKAFIAD